MNFKKVYLVDDNPITLFLHKDILADVLPNSVVVTYSRSELFLQDMINAPELTQESSLLLLDINMPNKTGFEILEELEEEFEDLDNLNVIMVSSSNLRRDIERSSRFNCIIGFLEKPLTVNNLKTTLLGGY